MRAVVLDALAARVGLEGRI